jgi:hypothetical protein
MPFLTVDVVVVVDASTTTTASLCRPYNEKNNVDEFHLRCSKKVNVDEIHLCHFFECNADESRIRSIKNHRKDGVIVVD